MMSAHGLVAPRRASGLIALTALTGLACEPPPVVPTQDKRQNTTTSRIEGELVVQGRTRGNAVVLLFDAARPPPPVGRGRPLAFAFVPAAELYGAALSDSTASGPFTAPYNFGLVPKGNYILRGFIDRDPSDFIPWYGVTNEPNKGDVGGAAVDAATRATRIITVDVNPVTDVAVSFADTQALPADRPVFAVPDQETPFVFDPAGGPRVIDLISTALPEQGAIRQSDPKFFARYADTDGNGVLELWPQVVVRKLADRDPPLLDENDLDRNGILDEGGVSYERADGVSETAPDAVVLAAGLNLAAVMPALTDSNGMPNPAAIVPLSSVRLVLQPRAFDASDPTKPVQLKTVPPGRYAIVIIQFTGQTWRIPNELQKPVADATGLPPVDSQSFFIQVP